MSASFHSGQAGIEHQARMPAVPGPEELPEIVGMDVFDDEAFKVFHEWDLRRVPHETGEPTLGGGPGRKNCDAKSKELTHPRASAGPEIPVSARVGRAAEDSSRSLGC